MTLNLFQFVRHCHIHINIQYYPITPIPLLHIHTPLQTKVVARDWKYEGANASREHFSPYSTYKSTWMDTEGIGI